LSTLVANSPLAHLGVGLVLGAVHACDADHVLTVTSFSRQGGTPRAAWGWGLRWSLAHGAAVIAAGVLLAALGLSFPHLLGAAAEAVVALVLCALGVWLLRAALVPRESERPAPTAGRRGIYVVGALHGLAGAAPVIALIPLARRIDPLAAGLYLTCFSLGVVFAMLLIATLLGHANSRALRYGVRAERLLNVIFGVGALTVGAQILLEVAHDAGAA
jgi:hypothetical protein